MYAVSCSNRRSHSCGNVTRVFDHKLDGVGHPLDQISARYDVSTPNPMPDLDHIVLLPISRDCRRQFNTFRAHPTSFFFRQSPSSLSIRSPSSSPVFPHFSSHLITSRPDRNSSSTPWLLSPRSRTSLLLEPPQLPLSPP